MTGSDKNLQELLSLETFDERLEYLRLNAKVGVETFGYDRYLNQLFYSSDEWRAFRDLIIVRDDGCDLGCPDRPISGPIYIHHIIPITIDDLADLQARALNPNNVICCSFNTHQAIHYGRNDNLPPIIVERKPNDTCPWKI